MTKREKSCFRTRSSLKKKATLSTRKVEEPSSVKAFTRLVIAKAWPTLGLEGQGRDRVNAVQKPDQLAEARQQRVEHGRRC